MVALNDRGEPRFGQQCCGGEVTLLFELVGVAPAVVVFGLGHVGFELGRLLARHDLDAILVDSRGAQVDADRWAPVLTDAVARVTLRHAPLPELVLADVPAGAHVVIMTHDHAEDLAVCDVALRALAQGRIADIGLIGSSAKWSRFRQRLLAEGHPPALVDRVTCPIGLPQVLGLPGKDPATIALGVAVALVSSFTPASQDSFA